MASSAVAICNQALNWLGGNVITSFTEDSDEAKLCNAQYELIRDAVLTEREWTFAVARAELSRLTATPAFGFTYQFQIPSDCLRILQISNAAGSNGVIGDSERYGVGLGDYNKLEWVREADAVLCNAERVYARYLKQVTDTTKFGPAFTQALAARIAMDLCIPLTENRSLQRDMAGMYGEKLAIAAAADGSQGRSQKIRSSELINVR